jgi:hypothetical protein
LIFQGSPQFFSCEVSVTIDYINQHGNLWLEKMDVFSDWILPTSVFLAPLILLTSLNRWLFGRKVCLLNHEGLFCNQRMIPWDAIDSMTFHLELPARSNSGCSYVVITGKNLGLALAHAPYHLLRAAKKYNPNIRTALEKGSVLELAIIFIGVFVFGLIYSISRKGDQTPWLIEFLQ